MSDNTNATALTGGEVAALRVADTGDGMFYEGDMQSIRDKGYIYFTETEIHITPAGR